ncbi:hypothetical protein C8J57DRAFT_1508064 [Mycena rebaudengoi]|nr:hypothetical protein C8J57DRAFT_1508064 [Mycena rebaudengoi]
MWAVFLRRKVFVVPLLISIVVGSFCISYNSFDFLQISLFTIRLLLFIPSAWFLQRKPEHEPGMHFVLLQAHCTLTFGLIVRNNIYNYTPREADRAFFETLLRFIAVTWATTWTYLSCIILSDRADILTRKHRSSTYCYLHPFIRKSGFGWFVWLVQPVPFPDAHLPVASLYPKDPSILTAV